ncbi:MAG: bifunctional 2-polyprenyl-6-hydroxyphenol methylase/3-demethylubiquinol 3-O-methyltransferase UbiG [Alphaproteobacteria bacterium]|nr:bifunctional 2-polyprenyl-6-hydroxyphenol methylase/3-demethylubiquinol 3-O-methyltransferase UbiG [Alphaproteobacteria bacterium]
MTDTPSAAARSTVDPAEIARFEAIAAEWWNPNGKFRPLHRFNPARLAWIRSMLATHFGRASDDMRPFAGLRVLDVGCGGGLVAEPMARLGAEVVAIDAAERNIAVARLHAGQVGLAIDYRCTTAEALVAAGERFDVVLSLEVVEHVADVGAFLEACAALVRPGGALVAATINRTPQAFALAIVGAEYVLRWLPRGTHRWSKFVRPSELAAALRPTGLRLRELAGVAYNPLSDSWRVGRDLGVNYMAFATR